MTDSPSALSAGSLAVEGSFLFSLSDDAVEVWRNWPCPGCGVRSADLEAGHAWSSERKHCWTNPDPDEYGRTKGGGDDA